MQIVELHLSHYNFYSPVTGALIMSEDSGICLDESCLGACLYSALEPDSFGDKTINDRWNALLAQDDLLDAEDIDAFFKSFTGYSNCVVFKLWADVPSVAPDDIFWIVVDMDTVLDEE